MAKKLTRREVAHFSAFTDEKLAREWVGIFTQTTKAGHIRIRALKYSDKLLKAAELRGLSLPCEGEAMEDWLDRINQQRAAEASAARAILWSA